MRPNTPPGKTGDLFAPAIDPRQNHLPYDGEVFFWGSIFSPDEADRYFSILNAEILWQPDQAVIFGNTITTRRHVAWYGERAFSYTYSGIEKIAHPWTDTLHELKQIVEKKTTATYNACLLNRYHSGEEGMAWHSDGERDLQRHAAIASLSFGAQRKFSFKHKRSKEKVDLWLPHGSLLVMRGSTQEHWLHRLPPTKRIHSPRINLTFRSMVSTTY